MTGLYGGWAAEKGVAFGNCTGNGLPTDKTYAVSVFRQTVLDLGLRLQTIEVALDVGWPASLEIQLLSRSWVLDR